MQLLTALSSLATSVFSNYNPSHSNPKEKETEKVAHKALSISSSHNSPKKSPSTFTKIDTSENSQVSATPTSSNKSELSLWEKIKKAVTNFFKGISSNDSKRDEAEIKRRLNTPSPRPNYKLDRDEDSLFTSNQVNKSRLKDFDPE